MLSNRVCLWPVPHIGRSSQGYVTGELSDMSDSILVLPSSAKLPCQGTSNTVQPRGATYPCTYKGTAVGVLRLSVTVSVDLEALVVAVDILVSTTYASSR